VNHVYIALGSLAEWATYLVIANRLGYITRTVFDSEKREADRLGQMLHALARSLEDRIERQRLGFALGVLAFCTLGTTTLLALG
jgi:hypothetical protein